MKDEFVIQDNVIQERRIVRLIVFSELIIKSKN